MQVAQRLYESGYITYMRTDSVNLSDTALNAAQSEIVSAYGDKYHQQENIKPKTQRAGSSRSHPPYLF
jgi:DNA topoisomerase-1